MKYHTPINNTNTLHAPQNAFFNSKKIKVASYSYEKSTKTT